MLIHLRLFKIFLVITGILLTPCHACDKWIEEYMPITISQLQDEAKSYFDQGQYREAADLYDDILKMSTCDNKCLREAAHLYFETGQFDKEIDTYMKLFQRREMKDRDYQNFILCFSKEEDIHKVIPRECWENINTALNLLNYNYDSQIIYKSYYDRIRYRMIRSRQNCGLLQKK